jgi:hypothetical protein
MKAFKSAIRKGPHPYEIGADSVASYFQVMQHCARTAHIKLQQRAEAPVR